MPDYGAMYTDKKISEVNRELRKTYKTAQRELKQKLSDFEKRFAVENKRKKEQLAKGRITQDDYRSWMTGRVFVRNQWESNIRQVNSVILDVNKQAMNIVNTSRFDVFAENYNFMAWQGERAINASFSLYNAESVAKLILEKPQLLPKWKIDEKKDYKWNYKRVNNIIRQGIIQGEGVPEITERLCRELATGNENKMRMFARTALNEAQNAGRQQQMNDAHKMGIEVEKEWIAVHDSRTRDSHRYLDGRRVPYNKPFVSLLGEIRFPSDPTADAADVFNCRCTMVTIYPKYDSDSEDWRKDEIIDGQTYEQWKKGKAKDSKTILTSGVVEGKDITETWKRRTDKFDFEIEDVINAQGFDGMPRVVSQEEFDKAVEESGLYAQRVYSAPTEEALEAYRKELYGGKFYVDCSVGGADFGQGMYMSGDFTGKKAKDVMEDSDRYVAISESRGNKHSFVEKMTLDKNSKIATYDSLLKEYQAESVSIQSDITRNVGHKLVEEAVNKYGLSNDDRNFLLWGLNIPKEVEPFDVMKASKYSGDKKLISSIRNDISSKIKAEKSANPIISANGDMGIYGAMKGYDAINIEGQAANGTSQVLVLNRTKLIIRRAK